MKLVKNLIRKYYKYVSWTQPVLTDYTTSTDLGDINVHATSDFGGNCRAWKIMIGSVSSTVDKDYWQLANSNAEQSLTLIFPYKLKISDLKITTRPRDNYTRNVGVFDSKGIQIGSTVNCKAALKEYTLLSDASIITDELIITVFAGSGNNTYFGLQNLQITAQRIAEGTLLDYDFYEDGFEYKAVKGEEKIELVPNVTVVGSPTINNGVISGFSNNGNYLTMPNYPQNISSFEIVVKFNCSDLGSSSTERCILGQNANNYKTPQIEVNSSRFWFGVSQNGSSWTGVQGGVPVANTDYWLKAIWTGTQISLSVSQDGENYTLLGSVSCSACTWTEVMRIGDDAANNDNFIGSIDLNESYIKINGETWWTGMREEVKYTYKGVNQ